MKLKHIITAITLLGCGTASAQQLQTAYFLDGYAYGHQLNPAKDYDRGGYLALPVIGGMQVGLNGNLNVQDILRPNPKGSGLTTYLNPNIGINDALSRFDKNNKLVQDLRLNLLSVGFHGFHGFNTIGINIRETTGVNVPYEFFELTKNLQNKNYNISSFGATAQSYAEIALGHSHNVIDGVRVGAKVKALVGLARLDASMDNLSLNLSDPNRWTATANATVEANVKGLSWGAPKYNEYSDGTTYQTIDFDNIDVDGVGPAGMGFAVDLGAEVELGKFYEPLKGLKVSVAANDLGSIKWKEGIKAVNEGKPFEFNGFNDIQIADGPGVEIGDQTDDLSDRLERLYNLRDGGAVQGTSAGIGATLVAGLEYALPVYDRLSFGLLYTQRFQQQYGWNEARLSATISPVSWLEASANVGTGTFGTTWGWVFNLHPKGFNVFVGMDHVIGQLSKQYIPLRSNTDLTFGIAFPLGSLQKNKRHKNDE